VQQEVSGLLVGQNPPKKIPFLDGALPHLIHDSLGSSITQVHATYDISFGLAVYPGLVVMTNEHLINRQTSERQDLC